MKEKVLEWHGQSMCLSLCFGVSCWWWVTPAEELYHSVLCTVLRISLLESKILALRDLVQRLLWGGQAGEPGLCTTAHHCWKKPSRKRFPVPKCCLKGFSEGGFDGIWLWRAFLLSFGSKQPNLPFSEHSNVSVQGGDRSWWCFLLWLLKLSILFSYLELTDYLDAFVNSRKLKRALSSYFTLNIFRVKMLLNI